MSRANLRISAANLNRYAVSWVSPHRVLTAMAPNVASMLAAARCQVNISARRRAQRRRWRSGRLTIVRTACAMASGRLSAQAPLSAVMISVSAEVRDTTAGVPHASDSSAASPNVSCGPGANATSADASRPATACRSEMKPVKSIGNPVALRSSLARSGPSPAMTSRASTPASHNAASASMQLARGIADVASATSGVSGLPNALDGIGGQLAQVRESAAGVQELLNNVGAAPLRELPDYLRELAAVSQSAPGVDLYAARRILTDPNMRAVLDYFVSPNGHATRLLVYGDGSEWGDDGAQRARAIVTAVAEETDEGTLRPTAVELTGVGPATRDLQDLVGSDLTLLAVITLAVIFAIAALLLRSPLAGLVVVGTIATSYICALGASVVIWKHILGDNLHWSVLPIAFVLLISVGSAYNLLFALRIREESSAGPRTSVIRAFAATGMVVTAAGIVFGTTMFALAASTSLSVAQIGVTVGMGLLLDALVIRGFVLPALMVLLGRWLWWPRRSVSNRQVPEPSPA